MRSFQSRFFAAMSVSLLVLAFAQTSSAQRIQGFEAGDPAVTATGDASARGITEGIAPFEGSFQYVISTIRANDGGGITPFSSDALAHPGLQNFFNAINPTAADDVSISDIEGSGFYFTFTLGVGQGTGISFNYDFLTNDPTSSTGTDRAVALLYNGAAGSGTALIGGVQTIATSNNASTVLATASKFAFHTAAGYGNTFTMNLAPGTYTLAIGVFDGAPGTGDQNSALLVDNVHIVPEPSTLGIGMAGAVLLLALRRVIKKTS
jgi:hypothetical protein